LGFFPAEQDIALLSLPLHLNFHSFHHFIAGSRIDPLQFHILYIGRPERTAVDADKNSVQHRYLLIDGRIYMVLAAGILQQEYLVFLYDANRSSNLSFATCFALMP